MSIVPYLMASWLMGLSLTSAAQTTFDSIPVPKTLSPTSRQSFSATDTYRANCVALPLIVLGVALKNEDNRFQALRNDYMPGFRTHVDDYLQYAPGGLLLGLKIGGVEGRSSWGRMAVADAFSATVLFATVFSLKSTTGITRPDGSNRYSFPSGHTATAFMTATMLHKEYGLTRSPWYSVAGYTIATATGLLRIANNKHWLSDVMVGAGIGIFSTEIGYYLTQLLFKEHGILRANLTGEPFGTNRTPSFLGLYLGFEMLPGVYPFPHGGEVTFSTGACAGIEGAWFWNQHWGVGGCFTASSLPWTRNGVAAADNLDLLRGASGLYFSAPLAKRWFIGSKLLAEYVHSTTALLSKHKIGNRNVFGAATGFSLTFRAQQDLAMKLFADYALTPSLINSQGKINHLVTVGGTVCILF